MNLINVFTRYPDQDACIYVVAGGRVAVQVNTTGGPK